MECVLHAKRTLGLAPSAPHTRPSAPHTRPSAGQCMVEVEQEGSRQASVPAPAARASKPRLSIQAPTQLVYLIKSGYYTELHKIQIQNTKYKYKIQASHPAGLLDQEWLLYRVTQNTNTKYKVQNTNTNTSSHPAGLPDQEWLLYRVTQT